MLSQTLSWRQERHLEPASLPALVDHLSPMEEAATTVFPRGHDTWCRFWRVATGCTCLLMCFLRQHPVGHYEIQESGLGGHLTLFSRPILSDVLLTSHPWVNPASSRPHLSANQFQGSNVILCCLEVNRTWMHHRPTGTYSCTRPKDAVYIDIERHLLLPPLVACFRFV